MTIKPNKHNALQTLCSHSFSDFIDTLKGERQFKPSNQFRNRNWVRVGPSLPSNAKFNQAIAVFAQGNALKAYTYRVFHVLYKNVVSDYGLISAAGSLLTPPFDCKRGAFVFVPPN